MTRARTQVGIVQWARRAEGARAAELWLADALGARVAEVAEPPLKIELARRARLHGWHAELWKSVVPVLPDVDLSAEDLVGTVSVAEAESVQARVEDAYRMWTPQASAVAEAPILRVLELITRDHEA